jgi:dTMP kinase
MDVRDWEASMATTGEGRGLFITLEGIDGCGKTTQAARLADALEAAGCDVVRLREPGGTDISEKVRGLLLDPSNTEMCPECELLLYEASRAQLVRQVISPALERGATVVCDRFFDSTLGIPGGGTGSLVPGGENGERPWKLRRHAPPHGRPGP